MLELTSRELLTHLYRHAIDTVDGYHVVNDYCRRHSRDFRYCVAIGKAASAMLNAVVDTVSTIEDGLLICPTGTVSPKLKEDSRIDVVESTHPIPDEKSLTAGRRLIEFLADVPDDAPVLFLISGGASSLVEHLRPGFMLEDIQTINDYLLSSGKDISRINYWRKIYSDIKGGGLLKYLNDAQHVLLIISDVKDDDLSIIGSGLLFSDPAQTIDEDAWLEERCPQTTEEASPSEKRIDVHMVATQKMAISSICEEAKHYGLECYQHEEFLEGDAAEQGKRIAEILCSAEDGVHVWGAETTVLLPVNPGMGGRNQHFALSAVASIRDRDICLLSAGSDGIDGNTRCAGAIVTGHTYGALRQMGIDIDDTLEKANSGSALMATDCLLKTGPSNTNVMDLVIAYKR